MKQNSTDLWLREAVMEVNRSLFDNTLPVYESKWQILFGNTGKKSALGVTMTPDYSREDWCEEMAFPTTISISYHNQDPAEIIATVAHECIHAFRGIQNHGSEFKAAAEKLGFQKPYTQLNLSSDLSEKCLDIYNKLSENFGDFPGYFIPLVEKEQKEKKRTSVKIMCPECGFECTAKMKIIQTVSSLPTCGCGSKMIEEIIEEIQEEEQ